jgi:alpha-galactosidase
MECRGLIVGYRYRDNAHVEDYPFPCGETNPRIRVTGTEEESGGCRLYRVECSPVSVNGDVGRIELLRLELSFGEMPEDTVRVFCNGFQSWTESREFYPRERMQPVRLLPGRIFGLRNYGDYHFKSYPAARGRFHSYTYTYLRLSDGKVVLFGSLSEDEGYTIFDIDYTHRLVRIEKECTGTLVTQSYRAFSIFTYQGAEEEAFSRYFAAFGGGRNPSAARLSSTVTGWTSWYNYYTAISEDIILSNLEAYAEHTPEMEPPVVFQIDDGYQTAVGDWLDIKPEFPRGMKFIAEAAAAKGFIPGLWLAPFVCAKNSKLRNEHPEWILKDDKGRPVSGGWNPLWGGTFYALDIGNQNFLNYLEKVFAAVLDEWGFGMVKLDFLYAAAMIPKRGKNRGQLMADALRLLKGFSRERLVLGCGVPLGSSFGIVDCCRIGSDVALKWEDRVLRFFRYRERVSVINSLTSTIGRHRLGGRIFLNDPDVFILRSDNCSLSSVQKRTLLFTNCLFGQLIFTSDNLREYSEEELRLYRAWLPHKPKRILKTVWVPGSDACRYAEFEIEGRFYLGFINLSRKTAAVDLPEGYWFTNRCPFGAYFMRGPENLECGPYESRCFLRLPSQDRGGVGKEPPVRENRVALAGTDGHIFPGSEVREVSCSGREIRVAFEPEWKSPVTAYLSVAGEGGYSINGADCGAQEPLPGLYIIKTELGR